MKKTAAILATALTAVIGAAAEIPPSASPFSSSTMRQNPCLPTGVAIEWDFASGDQGFTTTTCDPLGGFPLWEWGPTSIVPGAPANVWGTVLDGAYPPYNGEGLLSPPFACTGDQDVLEIMVWGDSEAARDGLNVTVNDMVVPVTYATDLFPGPIDAGALCVGGEDGFSGSTGGWQVLCFDLIAFWGQTIQVRLDFGADDLVEGAGWYLAYAAIGDDFIPVELQRFTVE